MSLEFVLGYPYGGGLGRRAIGVAILAAVSIWATVLSSVAHAELQLYKREEVTFMRGPYNNDFFRRHNEAFRTGAAIHFAHGKAHDVLQLSPLAEAAAKDHEFAREALDKINNPPRTEPTMELYGPFTAKFAWPLFRAIDWTHMLHEQTYDILSSRDVAWDQKKEWTDKTVRYYLDKFDIPRSPAPLDVTMRRAAVMMKPYFSYFRNRYPESNNFFYAAHWWHPVIYEAMMVGGPGEDQDRMVKQTDDVFHSQVLKSPPLRMLLSREAMPRYSRLSPESANAFDNLHMLHGIAYDILAYEGWTIEQKQKELERVIKAMSYQPGDEKLARKFGIQHPDMDPRVYSEWMKGTDGAMTTIMFEMMDEMMPMMMPNATAEMTQKMKGILRAKLAPGLEPGENPGSLSDALMAAMPGMKMSPEMTAPGQSSARMVKMMLQGWEKKHGQQRDVEPYSMTSSSQLTKRD